MTPRTSARPPRPRPVALLGRVDGSRRSPTGRTALVAGMAALCSIGALGTACGDEEPTAPTQQPADDTQPVNSMTQDSAMVPGGELNPQPAPETP